jgi:AraC-like DNA-binding protein
MPRKHLTALELIPFSRPDGEWRLSDPLPEPFQTSGEAGWQSNGGPHRGHPARSLPFSLDVDLGSVAGTISRLHLIGIFALHAEKADEAPGTLGASVQLVGDRDPAFRQDLLNGRHYSDPFDQSPIDRVNGDGTSVRTLAHVETRSGLARVDLLSIDVPGEVAARTLRFKDLGSPASFVIFDIYAEVIPPLGCPFHSKGGGIALSEVPALVRVGDRVRFGRALDQLERSILAASDLDEARGQALTFLALVTSAMLEMGGSRHLHRLQLEAAREFDRISDMGELAAIARTRVEDVTASVFKPVQSPSSYLVDRALALVDRNYARDLSDASVANQLGLSTSHFRFLFREATGQPFHKYLVAVRLERARELLIQQDIPVSEVARAVGFGGLSHFSRAFAQRFSVSPTHLRRGLE